MHIELINTGSELMLGRVLNTHQQWICRQLADAGYVVDRQVTVADEGVAISNAIRESLPHANLILTTGGLGPTSDDLTRDLIANMFGRTLRQDAKALACIETFFQSRNRPMPESTKVQAMVPEGAEVLYNEHGTAPGLAICSRPAGSHPNHSLAQWIILLPGPPRELRPMFIDQVLPRIKTVYPHDHPFHCRTLRTVGLGESWVEERIGKAMLRLVEKGLQLGYCARTGEVDIRFTTRSQHGPLMIQEAEGICRELLGDIVFGVDDDTMEETALALLTSRNETVSFAESCTGGNIANRFTNIPGASKAFRGGVVAYHNDAKQNILHVASELLTKHGAVSEPVAAAMAEGVRRAMNSDYAISTTGIAGPDGGSAAKPVGLVFIGVSTPHRTDVFRHINAWDRETFKQVTSQQALNYLRKALMTDHTASE